MKRLSHKEYHQVNQALLRLYEPVTPEHLPQHVFEVLGSVMSTDLVSICTHDPHNGSGDAYMSLPAHEFLLDLLGHMEAFHQMPGVDTGEYFNTDRAFSLRDFTTQDSFKHSVIYEYFYKQVDVLHDLIVNLNQGPNLNLQINLSRLHAPYSEIERFQLELLRPHLMARFRQISREYEDHPVFGSPSVISEQIWMLCRCDGRVLRRSAAADRVLAEVGEVTGSRLKPTWREWLEECVDAPDRSSLLPPLSFQRGRIRVLAHCLPNPRSGEHRIILQPSISNNINLTRRETEVLHWIRAEKTNAEIATILSISPGTVKVHVEHILSKLNVASRHAAAAFKI